MSAQKFFRFPFANAGDKAVIPDPAQGNGSISYSQGYGFDYERVPGVDPDAKRVPRPETNQLYFDITDNIRQYQLTGTPEWVDPSQNNGVSVAYDYGARVRYDAGSGVRVWFSIVTNNTVIPGSDDTKWVIDDPFNFALYIATNAEVQAGVVNDKIVTPANLSSRTATTTRTGLAALATSAEVIAGVEASKIVTPATLATLTATESLAGLAAVATTAEVLAGLNSGKFVTPASLLQRTATELRIGLIELATQAEVIAGVDAVRAVTPATLTGRLATLPQPIGHGQVWQTVARNWNVAYQNTTGRSICVAINTSNEPIDKFFQVGTDGVNYLTIGSGVGSSGSASLNNFNSMGPFIIPPNSYYRLLGDGALTWGELR